MVVMLLDPKKARRRSLFNERRELRRTFASLPPGKITNPVRLKIQLRLEEVSRQIKAFNKQ